MSVHRDQLYQEVWTEPMIAVAKRYGVSSNYLKRVCEGLSVPCPPRGHWAKLKAGQKLKRPELPAARPGAAVTWSRGHGIYGAPTPPTTVTPNVPGAKWKRLGERPERHPLLKAVLELYENGRSSEHGYLRPFKRALPDIVASKATMPRAIDVASAIYLTLEDKGYPVTLESRSGHRSRPNVYLEGTPRWPDQYRDLWRPDRVTLVFIGPITFGLTLYEPSEPTEMRYLDGKYVKVSDLPSLPARYQRLPDWRTWTTTHHLPSGLLALRAWAPYSGVEWQEEWKEKQAGDLERRARGIRSDLEAAIPAIHNLIEKERLAAEERARQWAEQKKRWQREEHERRTAQAFKDSRDDLLARVERWALAQRIDGFFRHVDSLAQQLPDDRRQQILERINQGREMLGGIDALSHFRAWKTPTDLYSRASDPDQ